MVQLTQENCRHLLEELVDIPVGIWGLLFLNLSHSGWSQGIDLFGHQLLRSCHLCKRQEHQAGAAFALV